LVDAPSVFFCSGRVLGMTSSSFLQSGFWRGSLIEKEGHEPEKTHAPFPML